ncbi:MAG: DUF4169 family protein [Alphaproteobacteria bacterium]|nr:DUF4169 family protein [Alphaproteobacteria bacterium]
MGDVVNLNQFRKRRARDEAERRASENRTRHGRSKAERRIATTEKAREDKALDGRRISPEPPDETQDD